MTLDPDDLPPGMTGGSNWERVVEALRTWRFIPGRHSPRVLGFAMKGDTRDEELTEQRQRRAREESRRHYEKMKDDPEWVEKRRAYYRERYKQGKDRR